jgi:VacB/RNase II family 3'-5' exoribonuclease
MLDASALAKLKQLKSDIHESRQFYTGTVRGSMNRFGFVTRDDGEEYFLPPLQMDRVFPGDQIEFEVLTDDKGKEYAEPTRLIKSELKHFVGQYSVRGKAHLVQPDLAQLNRMLFIPPKDRKQANNNDFVQCQVSKHPFQDGKAQARITKIIGNRGTPFLEHLFIKAKYQLRDEFDLKASQAVDAMQDSQIEELAKERLDLTQVPFVTIDNENTKDMDDALWAEKTTQGFHLMVAIADPTAWFDDQSELEKAAQSRGISHYLPGDTVTMLPTRLTHNLCSLVAGFERLAMVLDIQLNDQGVVTDIQFKSAKIKSQGKLSYQQVTNFLNDQQGSFEPSIADSLTTLDQLVQQLNQQRQQQCLIMEDRVDYRFELDENGKILSIQSESRTRAKALVEECMLLTNRLAADFLGEHNTGLFSSQPGFRAERLEEIQALIEQLAPELKALNPTELADFISLMQLAEKQHPLLRSILNKNLGRSEVSAEKQPHFAQGFEGYATITSPIRKYVDLFNLRQLHRILQQQAVVKADEKLLQQLQQLQLNSRQASNEVEAWLKCLYMDNFEGMEYEVTVVHQNAAGISVRIPENGVDGFIDLRRADPRPEFDNRLLETRYPELTVKLGDTLRVLPAGCNFDRKQVLFQWLDQPVNAKQKETNEAQ